MDTRDVTLHPEALAEIRVAYEWYRMRSQAAASVFLAELDLPMALLGEGPNQWPVYLSGTRRYLLHRFPFMVVFREVGSQVQVLAVAHARRRPGYWMSRDPRS